MRHQPSPGIRVRDSNSRDIGQFLRVCRTRPSTGSALASKWRCLARQSSNSESSALVNSLEKVTRPKFSKRMFVSVYVLGSQHNSFISTHALDNTPLGA